MCVNPAEYLEDIQAEPSFRTWSRSCATLAEVWDRCDRADWMLHLLENSGQPASSLLRKWCRETVQRFSPHFPEPLREQLLKVLDEGLQSHGHDSLTDGPNPKDLERSREFVVQLISLTESTGNWTPARAMMIALAALHDDPMAAARGTSEQAGMAAQYIHPFPTATDWPDEMSWQAAHLRQILGNPFQGL